GYTDGKGPGSEPDEGKSSEPNGDETKSQPDETKEEVFGRKPFRAAEPVPEEDIGSGPESEVIPLTQQKGMGLQPAPSSPEASIPPHVKKPFDEEALSEFLNKAPQHVGKSTSGPVPASPGGAVEMLKNLHRSEERRVGKEC